MAIGTETRSQKGLEKYLHQDRIAHAGKRQGEGQDAGSLVFEAVDPSLTVLELDWTFSLRSCHFAPRQVGSIRGIQTSQQPVRSSLLCQERT